MYRGKAGCLPLTAFFPQGGKRVHDRAEAGLSAREARIALGYNAVGFGGDGLSPAADTSRHWLNHPARSPLIAMSISFRTALRRRTA